MVRILVCCVIYNQDLFETRTYKSLLKGLDDVYIYDNSSLVNTKIDKLPQNWIYKSDPSNKGLSYAYNKVAKYAKDHGFEWLLLTDQDTLFYPNAYNNYVEGTLLYPGDKIFCPIVRIETKQILSPYKNIHYIGKSALHLCVGSQIPIPEYSIINSGMMVNIDAFLSVGGYNERVFLDFSDCQFIEKLSKCIKFARILDVKCMQSFSNIDLTKEEKKSRFVLFCRSLKYYDPNKKINRFWLFMALLRRACSLSYNLRSAKPLMIMYKNYIR